MLRKIIQSALIAVFCLPAFICFAQYKPTPHRQPSGDEIAVDGPGYYGKAGATYVLTKDITSPASPIFLGKDVTLDLNGYTIRYADGNYNHIANSGFEEGITGWDISRAPGAKVVNTEEVHVFVGKKLLSLEPGDEIRSPYVYLPKADRSYIAMCGVTGRNSFELRDPVKEMQVSVFVEDEKGNEVRCITEYADGKLLSSPVEKRSPRLGGGYVFAHLNKLPAGKYRIRVRADSDCLVDEIDIRPAFDAGIGIVGRTYAMGHYDHISGVNKYAAFFDYTEDPQKGTPLPGIPVANGRGTVTIKNGSIENGVEGAISWGVQSTADEVKVVLENLKIVTSGINTIAVDVPQATIVSCKFDVKSPFIISRHGSSFYAVDIRGQDAPSEVSFSEFYGGQGCLVFKGKHSSIHHNYFANRQMVTNHYSIMAMGDSSKIFNNIIEPEVGSGIEIYRQRYIDIFNNTIKIRSSPPTCEYGHEEYSTAAIRIADYNAKPGSKNGCVGNRFYSNKIMITVANQPKPDNYIPMSWAVYYSASGGDNYIFGNDIIVDHLDPDSKALAAAFYVCGGTGGFGGEFYNNRITTNVPAAWLATPYGGTANTKMYNNTIIRSSRPNPKFKAIRMGWAERDDSFAKNIEFRSNEVRGAAFDIDVTDQPHSYTLYWTLETLVKDKKGNPVKEADIVILDKNKADVFKGKTDGNGRLETTLQAASVNGKENASLSPFTVISGNAKKEIRLTEDSKLTLIR